MNILVTGSNGFIGQYLVKEIKNRHTLYQLINGSRYSLHNNKITANLLNINHIKFLLKEELKIDVVIHLAAKMCTTNNNKDFSLLSENIKIYEMSLLHLTMLLLAFGIVMLYSASGTIAINKFGWDKYDFFLNKHLIRVLIGLIAMVLIYNLNLKWNGCDTPKIH